MKRLTKKHRQAISKALKNKPKTQAHKDSIAAAMRRYWRSRWDSIEELKERYPEFVDWIEQNHGQLMQQGEYLFYSEREIVNKERANVSFDEKIHM